MAGDGLQVASVVPDAELSMAEAVGDPTCFDVEQVPLARSHVDDAQGVVEAV